jgi:transposase-like protein
MRGRRPQGPECVDRLEASPTARQRLKVVLEVLAGKCRVQQACQRLGVGPTQFHKIKQQVLRSALQELEPKPAGRPPQPASPQQTQVQTLQEQVADLQVQVQTAQVREELGLVLPRIVQPPQGAKKKVTRRRRRT